MEKQRIVDVHMDDVENKLKYFKKVPLGRYL